MQKLKIIDINSIKILNIFDKPIADQDWLSVFF